MENGKNNYLNLNVLLTKERISRLFCSIKKCLFFRFHKIFDKHFYSFLFILSCLFNMNESRMKNNKSFNMQKLWLFSTKKKVFIFSHLFTFERTMNKYCSFMCFFFTMINVAISRKKEKFVEEKGPQKRTDNF